MVGRLYHIVIISCFTLTACLGKECNSVPYQKKSVQSIDDVEIHYTQYGAHSSLLVFVHGWSCDQTYWSQQIEAFTPEHQVVTIDLAGHGLSTKGNRKEWSMTRFAKDVISVLEQLEYEEVVLIGHSMGTSVVLEVITLLREHNASVVCVDYLKRPFQAQEEEAVIAQLTPFYTDFESSTRGMVNTMFDKDVDQELKEWIIEDMSTASPSEALDMIVQMTSNDLNQIIDKVIKSGTRRYIINADYNPTNKELYEEEKGFKVEIIEETGHFLMMEAPDAFNTALASFIQSNTE